MSIPFCCVTSQTEIPEMTFFATVTALLLRERGFTGPRFLSDNRLVRYVQHQIFDRFRDPSRFYYHRLNGSPADGRWSRLDITHLHTQTRKAKYGSNFCFTLTNKHFINIFYLETKNKKPNKLNSHYYFNYYFMTSCNRPEGLRVRLFVPPSLLDRFSYWLPPFAGGDNGLDRLQANQFPAFHFDCDLSAYECCCCLFVFSRFFFVWKTIKNKIKP